MVGCPTREMRIILNKKGKFSILKRYCYQCVLVICVYKGVTIPSRLLDVNVNNLPLAIPPRLFTSAPLALLIPPLPLTNDMALD